jgi:hypothetical protein
MRRLDGGLMAASAYLRALGAEISERSTELILPGAPSSAKQEAQRERKIGVNEPDATYQRDLDSARSSERKAGEPLSRAMPKTPDPPEQRAKQRGIALPGDRGRETHGTQKQRPSFWRRIALGRRGAKTGEDVKPVTPHNTASATGLVKSTEATPAKARQQPTDSIDTRIVEPMLQALVSVESKLERSHIELIGRSDQIEQRLTQLWDIEEQLGALGELQESLLQVSEQQRRLESTIAAQNRSLRWLVGAVFFSLTMAAFVVAAVLR